jgi:translation initiation factor 2 beta subunit (eIF-2beta)/eIF-5
MYIQTIDGAHIIDINLGTIQTHFGVTSVENLSAGTKTLIVANHLNNSEIAIRLDNCGKNVLEVFFKDFIQSKIECFITHLVSIDMCEKLENFNLYFNNQIIELKDFNKNLKIEVERVYNDLI